MTILGRYLRLFLSLPAVPFRYAGASLRSLTTTMCALGDRCSPSRAVRHRFHSLPLTELCAISVPETESVVFCALSESVQRLKERGTLCVSLPPNPGAQAADYQVSLLSSSPFYFTLTKGTTVVPSRHVSRKNRRPAAPTGIVNSCQPAAWFPRHKICTRRPVASYAASVIGPCRGSR